jgi:hypothetical protein
MRFGMAACAIPDQCQRLLEIGSYLHLVTCRSKVVTDEGAFHKFISIAALHTATKHLPGPLTLSPRQATRVSGRSDCNIPWRGVPQTGHASAFKVISAPQQVQKAAMPLTSNSLCLFDDHRNIRIRGEEVPIRFSAAVGVSAFSAY